MCLYCAPFLAAGYAGHQTHHMYVSTVSAIRNLRALSAIKLHSPRDHNALAEEHLYCSLTLCTVGLSGMQLSDTYGRKASCSC